LAACGIDWHAAPTMRLEKTAEFFSCVSYRKGPPVKSEPFLLIAIE
jgi:hypothetical protein